MRKPLAALAVLAVPLLVLAAAGPASAAPRVQIVQVGSDGGQLRVVLSASGLPPGSQVDPASVRLTLDGNPVAVSAAPVAASAAKVARTAVLAIDTSGSMAGAGIAGAKAAADAFLGAVPADVRVGLVTFADAATLAVKPTTDRAAVRSAVAGLTARGETTLYDGTLLGLSVLGKDGVRTLVVLSDGADTRSKADLAATQDRLAASKAVLDAVAFRTSDAQGAVLGQLAAASGGRVIATSQAAGLASAFTEAARDVSGQLLVTGALPAAYAGTSRTLAVSATADGENLTDSVFVPLAAATTGAAATGPVPVAVDHGWLTSKATLYGALVALFVGLVALVGVAASSVRRDRTQGRVRRRLSIYTLSGRVAKERQETTVLGDSAVARSAVDLAGRVVAQRDFEALLTRKLEAGGVPLKPAEWLLIHFGVALGLALLLLLVSGGSIVAALVGLLAGVLAPFGYLVVKEARRTNAFLAALPDTLQLVAGSLSAGYSLPQAIDAVVRDGGEPVAGEFNRALVETRLGVPIEDALDGVAERMRSKDFSWVVMAIRIQREVGGNLAEILTTVSATLRERERLRRQVKVLSAEGRLSAYILFGLPVVFGLYLLLVRRSYIRPLYTDNIGILMLVFLAITLTIGGFWLRKVVRVEV